MPPDEIEFIGGTVSEVPPDLPRPPRRRAPALRVAVVGLLLAGGVAWTVTRHTGEPRQPVPQAAPPSITITCDAATGCHTSVADIVDIKAALASHLPTAALSALTTTVEADHGSSVGIAQRIIDAHIDSVDVLLRIRPYLHPEPVPTEGITPTPPGLGSAFFRFTTAAFVVDVQWTGTDATPPPVADLQALADDPRLEALN
jgi:hypothetical protein